MTTPRPTLFPATTPRTGVLVLFVIISDFDDKITTLPVRPAPPSSDRIPALHGYPLESGDDSSDEDLSETAETMAHTRRSATNQILNNQGGVNQTELDQLVTQPVESIRETPTQLQPLPTHVLTRNFAVSCKGILVELKVQLD
ncbi:hypothetical protein Tco_0113620 [Tanacetum coccineum]